MLETDRGHVVRQMIEACRKGGHVVIMGVYGLFVDKFPLGVAMNKGLQFRMGQQHGQRYVPRMFEYTEQGRIDPAFCFTHRYALSDIPQAYDLFANRDDNGVKVLVNVA